MKIAFLMCRLFGHLWGKPFVSMYTGFIHLHYICKRCQNEKGETFDKEKINKKEVRTSI